MSHQALSREFQRFILLWRYQHPILPFTFMWRLVLKRMLDVLVAGISLVLAAPLMALVALAIRLDSQGPAFYTQERLGWFGEPFTMLKFRTMHMDAEAAGPVWACGEADPRITRVGRILRRLHLDELPQLFNVLGGDMSLVGPRPERPYFVDTFDRTIPRYDERLLVKPGITGLAQVSYRYDQSIADVKRKLRLDLLYIKRMCLTLDLRILAWTVLVVTTGRGIR
ncbi:MAG: exopolysaccharide biosynthesis polyprenyl glycosylphosphotransferase [Candidatus Omnitrophica bacterium]|nr:exopolysaccharide biosynthesis polyprenyl glycosylphosphotransferase [Candidatus Omnitrophota bacterium]